MKKIILLFSLNLLLLGNLLCGELDCKKIKDELLDDEGLLLNGYDDKCDSAVKGKGGDGEGDDYIDEIERERLVRMIKLVRNIKIISLKEIRKIEKRIKYLSSRKMNAITNILKDELVDYYSRNNLIFSEENIANITEVSEEQIEYQQELTDRVNEIFDN